MDPSAGAGAAVDPARVFLTKKQRGPDVVAWDARFGRGGGFWGFDSFKKDLDGGKDSGGGKKGLPERTRTRYDCRGCVINGGAVRQVRELALGGLCFDGICGGVVDCVTWVQGRSWG